MKTIICFGDSVTRGTPYVQREDTFVRVLERRLNARRGSQEPVRCINAGVGGENTAEGLARIGRDVLEKKPDLVVIEFGLNDIRYEPEKTIRPRQFVANLKKIHRLVSRVGADVVFTTPNPIINSYHPYSQATDYYDQWGGCNGAVAEYAGLVREVAVATAAYLCDIYQAFIDKAMEIEFLGGCQDHSDLRCLGGYISTVDGVHPWAPGHQLIAWELYRLIVGRRILG